MDNLFTLQFKEYADRIHQALPSYLPSKDCAQASVIEAMEYSLMAGGKRIRAVLAMAFCELCGGSTEDILPFAAAIEMVHSYSLIHDDLPCMDDDNMRRGKPSCHKAYGESTALLAGDGLLNLAFETILDFGNTGSIPAQRVLAAAAELASASGVSGMIGGQVIDLASEGKEIDTETLINTYRLKTSALIRASAKIGCIIAGTEKDIIERADRYAANIGMAFQIVDDILDVTADESLLGKPIGSDEQNDKTTFVSLYGIERSREIVKQHVLEADLAIKGSVLDNAFLYDLADMLADREY